MGSSRSISYDMGRVERAKKKSSSIKRFNHSHDFQRSPNSDFVNEFKRKLVEEEIQGQCDCAFHIMFFIALIVSKILTSVAQNYVLLRITRYTFQV